jgi:hypothetical protein
MEKGMEEKKDLFEKGEEFLEIFRKGQEFTQALLRENERLRYRLVQLEEAGKASPPAGSEVPRQYAEKLRLYESRLHELEERLGQIEEENRDFAQRYLEVEDENNKLANLYVASFQLHSTLDFDEVVHIILEIVINLIGAEEFGILLLDPKTNLLAPVAAEGIDAESIPSVKLGEGAVGRAAIEGENYINPSPSSDPRQLLETPLVVIGLKIKEQVIGVVTIYSLLQQKKSFSSVDHELFTLLGGHAATAIFSSRLYSESRRKLSTYKNFVDLLSKPEDKEI